MDAFCGVGGHAIAFAQTREHVIAIDNGETLLRLVRHNATIYGVVDRIDFVPGDFTAQTSLRISLNTLNSDFQVSRQSMITSCFKLAERITPNIACHLPRNTNLQGISDPVTNAEAGGAKGKDKAQVMEVEEEWLGRC